jgi:AcrR family transcriptional regulator
VTTIGARERLLLAAEQLVAERGPEVPLRDIAIAAGQRNNSAVQYYFGSRDGLIDAVVEHRMPALEARRVELLAEHEAIGDADDPRVLVELLARPMLEAGERVGATHLNRFLDQVRNHPAVHDGARLANENRSSVRLVLARFDRALGSIPDRTRHRRVRWMSTALLSLLADHERAVEAGHVDADDVGLVDDLLDAVVAMLTVP